VIRVLHIVTHMNRGGLETMIMNYYRQINKNVVQFDFLVHRKERADYDDEIETLGGTIYRLSPLNPLSISYRMQLDSFFAKHREYKIVHCHLNCMSSLVLFYAQKNHIPVRIAHAHNTNQEKGIKFFIKSFYQKRIPSVSTELIACSEKAGLWMFRGKDFTTLNNAIDSKRFAFNLQYRRKIRDEFGINDEIVIGHIGRFDYQKNHDFLIDIFQSINNLTDKKTVLLLVGNGDKESEVRTKVNRLGLSDRVIFTGVRSNVNELIQAMDIFVFPSRFEGLPVTLVEVQTSGLQCIISDKVPEETVITENLVSVKSLNESAEEWAIHILSRIGEPRYTRIDEVKAHGYDIEEASKWLENYYLNKLK